MHSLSHLEVGDTCLTSLLLSLLCIECHWIDPTYAPAGLPEVLSGALSLNMNQLNSHLGYTSPQKLNIVHKHHQAMFSTM